MTEDSCRPVTASTAYGKDRIPVVKKVLRCLVLLFVASCALGAGNLDCAAAGEKVLVLQSVMIPLYEEVVQGFTSVCSNESIERLTVHEQRTSDLLNNIQTIKPDLIVAIGLEALKKTQDLTAIPVVYCMILSSSLHQLGNGVTVTGVSMNISQDQQLKMFHRALPQVKSIGLLYNAEHTGLFAESAVTAAQAKNITVVSREITSPKEVAPAMEAMKGVIDAFWMLPDMTLINEVTIEYMLSFSMENRIPLLTFSNMYVEQGALMSISVDTLDIGAQAGEMAKKILSGTAVKDVPPVDARKLVSHVNLSVAEKLGIGFSKEFLNQSVIVH